MANEGAYSQLDKFLTRLNVSLEKPCHDETRHRNWSRFIRARDDHRCVVCNSTKDIAAHHIFRKSLLREARFQTGNGATLCRICHDEAHQGFNGAADLAQPIDAQGGEKLERVAELYGVLARRSQRHPGRSDYYHLSEPVIAKFMAMQMFDEHLPVQGTPIERAWYIWDCFPPPIMAALISANLPGA